MRTRARIAAAAAGVIVAFVLGDQVGFSRGQLVGTILGSTATAQRILTTQSTTATQKRKGRR